MEKVTRTKHDFVTETKGRCFLCSKTTSFQYSSAGQESPSIYSLHCLASYLKIDMEKVFTGNEPIPSHLVERVKKSRLKAELCGDCAVLNKRFSNIFRQLEKVEMEATSCLSLIQQKLERVAKFDSAHNWSGDSNDHWISKLEIAEALRQDTMRKCSRKLGSLQPQIKIKRITSQQIKKEKSKVKLENTVGSDRQSDQYPSTSFEHYDDDTGSPASIPALGVDDESYLDKNYALDMEAEKTEMMEGFSVSDTTFGTIKVDAENSSERNNIGSSANRRAQPNMEQLSQAIPSPLIVGKEAGLNSKPNIVKDLDTGKYKCPICSKEYATEGNVQLHYKSAHLKVRFTCGTCKRHFPQKRNYERHYLSIHMGARFKCNECNQIFTQKFVLAKHQKNTHTVK